MFSYDGGYTGDKGHEEDDGDEESDEGNSSDESHEAGDKAMKKVMKAQVPVPVMKVS